MFLEKEDPKTIKMLENSKFNYHQFLYSLPNKLQTHWNNTILQKNPLDLWIYIELIQKIKPDLIIECGTASGASASFFSTIQKSVKPNGNIITIDVKDEYQSSTAGIYYNCAKLNQDGIMFITGDSLDLSISNYINEYFINDEISVLVSLDSNHSKMHVEKELDIYSKFVTQNSYLVVEDSNIGINIDTGYSGPREAIDEFLLKNSDFSIDLSCEKFGITYNPGGWLKKS